MSKVLVIGGGAAGMMAAISAANCGHSVQLFEKNEKLGKKVYITGKGRCNITNVADLNDVFNSIVTNSKFMYSAFYSLTNEMVIDIFNNDYNIPTKIERGNRVFPVSDKSSDVIGGLSKEMSRLRVDVCFNQTVKELEIEKGTVTGVKLLDGSIVKGDSVIVATGGISYPSTGSTGDGYKFAKATGHKVTEIYPALVPIMVKEEFAKELQGLALKNVKVSFWKNGKDIYSDFGEMLFTHFGLSGPIILSGSSHVVKYIKNNEVIKIKIDLKPSLSKDTLDDRILREFKDNINKNFENSLGALLPKSIIPIIINLSGINKYKKVNEITKEERKRLVEVIKELTLTVSDTRGFNEAIITQGGINVKDINPATMESKHVNNLYFVGEVLDVDALTGGFNLQIAWSTGYLAGISVN